VNRVREVAVLPTKLAGQRQHIKQTAHLLSQMGGCIAVRHHGGITPEAELSRDAVAQLPCGGWSAGGVGRVLCCDMNWSNSSLSLA
jgi:hypothetical protein